jgi:hypothetical protein
MLNIDETIMSHDDELIEETLTRIRPFLEALDVAPERVVGLAVTGSRISKSVSSPSATMA